MLLFLQGIPRETIMLIGRWQSDAFLLYLRRDIKEFTSGVSTSLSTTPINLFNIPSDKKQHDHKQITKTHMDHNISSTSTRASPQQRFYGPQDIRLRAAAHARSPRARLQAQRPDEHIMEDETLHSQNVSNKARPFKNCFEKDSKSRA